MQPFSKNLYSKIKENQCEEHLCQYVKEAFDKWSSDKEHRQIDIILSEIVISQIPVFLLQYILKETLAYSTYLPTRYALLQDVKNLLRRTKSEEEVQQLTKDLQ